MTDLKRRAHADPTQAPDQAAVDSLRMSFTALAARWRTLLSNLDAFWPVLAVILVAAVIFVASVAHRSMNGVGARLPVSAAARSHSGPVSSGADSDSGQTEVIVQISSHPTRAEAQTAADEMMQAGVQARVLDSDDYRPLNRGYFVVYAGPYPETAAGRANARQLENLVPGALLRDVRHR